MRCYSLCLDFIDVVHGLFGNWKAFGGYEQCFPPLVKQAKQMLLINFLTPKKFNPFSPGDQFETFSGLPNNHKLGFSKILGKIPSGPSNKYLVCFFGVLKK